MLDEGMSSKNVYRRFWVRTRLAMGDRRKRGADHDPGQASKFWAARVALICAQTADIGTGSFCQYRARLLSCTELRYRTPSVSNRQCYCRLISKVPVQVQPYGSKPKQRLSLQALMATFPSLAKIKRGTIDSANNCTFNAMIAWGSVWSLRSTRHG